MSIEKRNLAAFPTEAKCSGEWGAARTHDGDPEVLCLQPKWSLVISKTFAPPVLELAVLRFVCSLS